MPVALTFHAHGFEGAIIAIASGKSRRSVDGRYGLPGGASLGFERSTISFETNVPPNLAAPSGGAGKCLFESW
jgi:hypothetical protein